MPIRETLESVLRPQDQELETAKAVISLTLLFLSFGAMEYVYLYKKIRYDTTNFYTPILRSHTTRSNGCNQHRSAVAVLKVCKKWGAGTTPTFNTAAQRLTQHEEASNGSAFYRMLLSFQAKLKS